MSFCEESLCAWIKQPANTWSNIAYIAVGTWMWVRAGKDGARGLRLFAVASWITGLGSALFHATGTSLAGASDYLGMFLESGAMTALNLRRWRKISWPLVIGVFLATTLFLMGAIHFFPRWERWIYALGSPCYLIEIRLYFLYGKQTKYRYLGLSWLVMLAATGFWAVDIGKTWCDPQNHFISGHALWHIISALALVPLYRFYLGSTSLKGA